VLVLDQFEEIFTLGRRTEARRARWRAFLESLGELVENIPPEALRQELQAGDDAVTRSLAASYVFDRILVHVMLSLREDYLAPLEALRPLLPTIRQNRMPLEALSRSDALRVVEEPARRAGGGNPLADGASTAIVDFVAARRLAGDEGAVDEDRPVDPAF
jgi:hypothetical protein